MSNLEELIERLCPDGVEYKTLGEVATDIYRGAEIKRDQIRKTGTPCVRYGEIYTTYGIFFGSCVSYTDESLLTTKKYFEYGDILFAITGERVEDIAKSCAYVGHEKCLAGGDIVVLKHNEDPKYLSYALATTDARRQKSFGKSKNKVVHSSVPAIKSIKLPVPPLEVQREIVRILDNFTLLTAELVAELEARQKQYEYYRNSLLTFEDIQKSMIKSIPWVKLDNIIEFKNGKGHEKCINENGQYIVVNSKFISTNGRVKKFSDQQLSPLYNNDILMVMSDLPNGQALAKTYLVKENSLYTLNQRICALTVKNKNYSTKFLFYYLNRNKQLLKYDNGVDQTNLKKGDILTVIVPVISLAEQQRIVDILDRFDTLCNDISSGLPAEIEARQKQYEYYRDKLLNFKELKKEA